jgi:hypothetical protein
MLRDERLLRIVFGFLEGVPGRGKLARLLLNGRA